MASVLREEPDHVLYEARLGADGPRAALKVMDPTVFHDARYYKLLRRASRRWKRVANPGVARLLDAGKSPEGPYLVTEPVAGPTLARELESGAMAPTRAVRTALELGGALDVVLAAGIAPGALTPRNVVMADVGAVVTDPGVGRARHCEEMIEADGALHYLSPEEAVGAAPLPQSAVYSLACIMHECLTGEPPYLHELPQAVIYAHVADPPALPRERNRSLPRSLDDVFERAMAVDPRERQPTPAAFARDMTAALGFDARESAAPAQLERPPLVVVPDIIEPEPGSVEHVPKRVEPKPEVRTRGSVVPASEVHDPEPEAVGPTEPPEPMPRGPRPRQRSLRVLRVVVAVAATAACATAGLAAGSSGSADTPSVPRAAAGPPPGAIAAQETVKRLDGRRGGLRARLAGTRKRAGQAVLAERLSSTYVATARRVPVATPVTVRQALRGSGRAYGRLASAARRDNPRAWAEAREGVRRAEGGLTRALRHASASQ